MPTTAPNIIPGQPITPEQRTQLADFNREQSEAAQKMAADHRTRDMAASGEKPLLESVAASILGKLNVEHLDPPKE